MQLEITWNKNISDSNKNEIEKFLQPYLWLTPNWCQEIHINLFDYHSEGYTITADVNYGYRFVQFDFYPGWLNQTEAMKQDNVIHELIHSFVNILYLQAREFVQDICDDEKLKTVISKQLSKTVESVTQDLTFAIINQPNKA